MKRRSFLQGLFGLGVSPLILKAKKIEDILPPLVEDIPIKPPKGPDIPEYLTLQYDHVLTSGSCCIPYALPLSHLGKYQI